MRRMFVWIVVAATSVSGVSLIAQNVAPAPDVSVCGRELAGTARVHGTKAYVRQGTVELMTAKTEKVIDRTTTNRSGRFKFGGGAAPRGSEWFLRITGPGKNTTLVKFTIDFNCDDPLIDITPGNSGK